MAQSYTELLRQRIASQGNVLNPAAAMGRGGASTRPVAPSTVDTNPPLAQGPNTAGDQAAQELKRKIEMARLIASMNRSGNATTPTQPPGSYDAPGAQGPNTVATQPVSTNGINPQAVIPASIVDTLPGAAPENPPEQTGTPFFEGIINAVTHPKESAKAAGKAVMAAYAETSRPFQWNVGNIGDAVYELSVNPNPPDWVYAVPGGPEIWTKIAGDLSPETKASVIAAHDQGGGNGVWENVIAASTDELPWYLRAPIRAGIDTMVDPLGYPLMVFTGFGGALVRGGTEAAALSPEARLAWNAARGAADPIMYDPAFQTVVGKLFGLPQEVFNYSIDAPFNAVGHLAGKAAERLRKTWAKPIAEQFGENATAKAAETANLTDEALKIYAPVRDGMGFDPTPPVPADTFAPATIAPDLPLYTMKQEGDTWVIVDPQGTPTGETFPYKRRTGTEPNRPERDAQRYVNSLNQPIIRPFEEANGAILPAADSGLTWTAPNYDRLTNRGRDMGTTTQAIVAYDNTLDPALRRQWMDEWTPKALEHERVMADIRQREIDNAIRAGQSIEQATVQSGRELVSPAKTYETVRFVAQDTMIPYQKLFPDAYQPKYRWITTPELDKNNASNLIEHAVFGSRENAILARKTLRQKGISLEGFRAPSDFVDALASIGEELRGSGWRSQTYDATYSRAYRARMNGEPQPTEAAIAELAGQPPKITPLEATAPQPPEPTGVKPTAKIDVAQDDAGVLAQLQDSSKRWRTPGENLIKRVQGGEVQITNPGRKEFKQTVRLVPTTTPEGVVWDVQLGYGRETRQTQLAALGDAMALADELLVKMRTGIEPDAKIVQRTLDGLNTLGIINANPSLAEQSRQAILRSAGALEGPGATDLISRGDSSLVGVAHQIGKIDTATYEQLNAYVTYNGDEMRVWEAFDRALHDAPGNLSEEEQMAWARRVVSDATIDPETKAALLVERVKTAAKRGEPTPQGAQPYGTAKRRLYRALGIYQGILKYLRETTLYNWATWWRGASGDAIGTAYTMLIHGEAPGMTAAYNPDTVATFIRSERGKTVAFEGLPGYERMKYITGHDAPPSVVELIETKYETGHDQLVLEKLGSGYHAVRPLSERFAKAVRTGMDRSSRYGVYIGSGDRYLNDAQIRFRGIVATRAERLGKSPGEVVEWLKKLDALGDTYNSTDILDTFGDTRLSRDWQELASGARMQAKKRVDDVLLSYKQTNLDNKLRNVIFFHYWMSRAFVVHAKAALKNPWLLNTYVRAWQAMEREAEQNGYPPNVRGYIRMMGSQAGMYGLINPVNIVVPFSILIENQQDPGTLSFLRRWGLFINPLIEAAAAVVGHSKQLPDLTGTTQIRRAARMTVNYLNTTGAADYIPDWLGDPNTWQGSIVADAEYRIMDSLNTTAQRVANWLSPDLNRVILDYQGSNPNAFEEDQLRSIAVTYLEAQYGPFDTWGADSPAWDSLQQVIDDIKTQTSGNMIADAVVEQYAKDKAMGTAIGGVLPGGLYQRYGPRDVTMAEAKAGDLSAKDLRDIETAGNPDLTIQRKQLDILGTEDQRWAYKSYNEISYDDVPLESVMTLNGQQIRGYELNKMSTAQREELARRWVAQYVPLDQLDAYVAERSKFLDAHPEVGDFKEFESHVYRYDGGPKAWRAMYAKKDRAFADKMREQETYWKSKGFTGDVLNEHLDQWAAGQGGYEAANGMQSSLYDAPADPKVPDYGFTDAKSSGSTSSTPKTPVEKLRDSLASYDTKMSEALAAMRAAGYSVTEQDLYTPNPYLAGAYDMYGVPSMTDDVFLYKQWQMMNDGQGVDAYIRYLTDLGRKGS